MAKFLTRARAVDMLGRQQIAGPANALNELFKNAHDAYASRVEVDYLRAEKLLVLRDDGFGMTREDFEQRWLAIGTESKVANADGIPAGYRPPGVPVRQVMGEKGIGRLAVALLGKQALILTRASRFGVLHDGVACIIHWGLFGIPGLNLDDIEIPVRTFQGGTLPTRELVGELISAAKESLRLISAKWKDIALLGIEADLDAFAIDPSLLIPKMGGLSLAGEGCGTQFLISPTDEIINIQIEDEATHPQGERVFTKWLVGFSNDVFCSPPKPPIQAALREWTNQYDRRDLLEESGFFQREDLRAADHQVIGRFDEFGTFRGTVRVYEKEEAVTIPWQKATGKKIECGPFEIEFGYVMGVQRQSRMDPDSWARLSSKVDQIGGLYVYRDGLRILPYGNSDYDWLGVEMRRTKGAGYYFFSYRRFFGGVCITKAINGALSEKAGREGFQENKAYRQFSGMLSDFLVQAAARFFREDDTDNFYSARRKELIRLDEARKRREKSAKEKRGRFRDALGLALTKARSGTAEAEVRRILAEAEKQMQIAGNLRNPDEAATTVLAAERDALGRLTTLRTEMRVVQPRGIGLTKADRRDLDSYRSEYEKLEEACFQPAEAQIARTLTAEAKRAAAFIDQRKRLDSLLTTISADKRRQVNARRTEADRSAEEIRARVASVVGLARSELERTIDGVMTAFGSTDLTGRSAEDVETLRNRWQLQIEDIASRNNEALERVVSLLNGTSEDLESQNLEEVASSLDAVEAIDEDLLSREEEEDEVAESLQLGQAVAVIHHEFASAINGVRKSLRELNTWSDRNPKLHRVYENIRASFDHLDGHLSLFTPLQRRLRRVPVTVYGHNVVDYVRALFDVRMTRHHVELTASEAFKAAAVDTYPSTLYAAYVNLLDNAIYWLSSGQEPRRIHLDVQNGAWLISNNGPAIDKKTIPGLFQRGFSTKPSGRGLGLYISRTALSRLERPLELDLMPKAEEGYTVTFAIRPSADPKLEDDNGSQA